MLQKYRRADAAMAIKLYKTPMKVKGIGKNVVGHPEQAEARRQAVNHISALDFET